VLVCILPGKAIPEMTYTVSGGTLSPTHSLSDNCYTSDNCCRFLNTTTLLTTTTTDHLDDTCSNYCIPLQNTTTLMTTITLINRSVISYWMHCHVCCLFGLFYEFRSFLCIVLYQLSLWFGFVCCALPCLVSLMLSEMCSILLNRCSPPAFQ